MDLFNTARQPLSRRMMPQELDHFMGQSHLTGPGKPIRTMLENKLVHSMVFYGPPACGKTSLAEIIARQTQCLFLHSNALTLDSDEIRSHLHRAGEQQAAGGQTILFIDEIHRLYKPKQDAFLSALENGLLHIIGATTENPFFILQPALRSRLFIYEFTELSMAERGAILDRALAEDVQLQKLSIELTPQGRNTLLEISADPRMMLNTLEMCVLSHGVAASIVIDAPDIENVLQKTDTRYSDEEGHYDTISAFIKSVRGSDPDAAVYYLMLMLESGEDPLFIARRLMILAGEDIGLAYPEGLSIAVAAYQAAERLGMPEAVYPLAHTTLLLAGVPKSNSATTAISQARADIQGGKKMPIPAYLRGSSFSGAKELGRGIGYKYPHDFPNHFVAQDYTTEPVSYYTPGELGFEKKIRDWLEKLRQ